METAHNFIPSTVAPSYFAFTEINHIVPINNKRATPGSKIPASRTGTGFAGMQQELRSELFPLCHTLGDPQYYQCSLALSRFFSYAVLLLRSASSRPQCSFPINVFSLNITLYDSEVT